jgi:hypothetical protein
MIKIFSWLGVLCFLALSGGPKAQAASCCGKGAAAPSLLTGEASMQVFTQIQHQATSLQQVLGGSFQISDAFQGGLQLPFHWRGGFSRIPALRTYFGFEWMPEWVYPGSQGYLLLGFSLPLVRPQSCCSLHTRTGYWTPSMANVFLHRGPVWDFFHLWEVHVSFIERFQKATSVEGLAPGWGGSLMLAGGYSLEQYPVRFGLRFSPRVDQYGSRLDWITGRRISPKKGPRWECDIGFDVSWMFSNVWSLLFGATQALLSAESRRLGPALSLQWQWRQPR